MKVLIKNFVAHLDIKNQIIKEFVKDKPKVEWNEVIGLHHVKELLQESALMPLKFPLFFSPEGIIIIYLFQYCGNNLLIYCIKEKENLGQAYCCTAYESFIIVFILYFNFN